MTHNNVRLYVNAETKTKVWLPSPALMESFVRACEASAYFIRIIETGAEIKLVPSNSGCKITVPGLKAKQTPADRRYSFNLPQAVARRIFGRFGLRPGNDHVICDFTLDGPVLIIDLETERRGRLSKTPQPPVTEQTLTCDEAPAPKPSTFLPPGGVHLTKYQGMADQKNKDRATYSGKIARVLGEELGVPIEAANRAAKIVDLILGNVTAE